VLSPVPVVLLVVVVFVAVKAASGSNHPKSGVKAGAADASVAAEVTGAPASVLDTVGKGSIEQVPTALTGAALTDSGKPQVVFIGAEWCPYCAAERWPLTVALSRFGKLTGLGQVRSSPSDIDPNTATLTFHGASYTSAYLSLTAKEIYSNQAVGNSYAKLERLTADEQNLFMSVGKGSFPRRTARLSVPDRAPQRARSVIRSRQPRLVVHPAEPLRADRV
jgi:thiol-disulfide isomerase/thioredoxin